jgi:hypothetical protein
MQHYTLLPDLTYVAMFSQHTIVGSKLGSSLGNSRAEAKSAGAFCCSAPSCKHSLNIPIDTWMVQYLFPCEELPRCISSGYYNDRYCLRYLSKSFFFSEIKNDI